MKRIISFLTLLAMLTTMLTIFAIPTSAETNYDDNLVSWWNFEGDTADEQAADKAQKGTADKMTFSAVSVADGKLQIPSTKGSYASIPYDGDVTTLNGKTLYMSFRTVGVTTTSNATDLVSLPFVFRYWVKNSSTDPYGFGGGVNNQPTKAGYKLEMNADTPTAIATGSDWYHLAITFQYETNLTIKIYNSADGAEYTLSENVFSTSYAPTSIDLTRALFIGKYGATTADNGIGYTVNEIRFYNTILSADAISELAAHTPYETEDTPDSEPIDSTVSILGPQDKINASNLLDVRFIAHINVTEADLALYDKVGFEVSATYGGATKPTKTISSNAVYKSVIADGVTVTPATYGLTDGYLFAIPIYNIPMEGTVTFAVKPFCEADGVTEYGTVYTVTYTDGSIVD